MIKVLIIVGPTAVGKSSLAVKLAKKFNGEIISADSRQIYKGLNIGTGKISREEMDNIPHYLLDIEDPKKRFSVSDYVPLAHNAINFISHKKSTKPKLPIICGGTGFYIDSLINNIIFPEIDENPKLRKQLECKSCTELMKILGKLDPERAKNIDPNNQRRIIRAIEIANALGHVPKLNPDNSKYDPLFIGINLDRKELGERIMLRLIQRLDSGMISEVENLHKDGLTWKRMEELGLEYRYLSRFARGQMSREEMIAKLYSEICHYAKRQITWWRRNKKIHWFAPSDTRKIEALVKNFIK